MITPKSGPLSRMVTLIDANRALVGELPQGYLKLANPQFAPAGHYIGRARMILGMLYKAKKRRDLALEHLTVAKRILFPFGQNPLLARLDAALAELR